MIKVAIIGAGSLTYTRALIRDILTVSELQDTFFSFTDTDPKALDMQVRLAQREIRTNRVPASVEAAPTRRQAIEGANYVINLARVGGLEALRSDIEIPLKYGVAQCVGETLCAGGIMAAQRGVPAMLEFCHDIRDVASSDVIFLNYADPCSMLTWAANEFGDVPAVGLGSGVARGHQTIARALGTPQEEIDILCAGIHGLAWYLQVLNEGMDARDQLLEAFEIHPQYAETEKVRLDLLRRTGYFCTEESGNVSDLLPWYRKRLAEIAEWSSPGEWLSGETGGYLRALTALREVADHDFAELMAEPVKPFTPQHRSSLEASYIIEALETGQTFRAHINVVNSGVIANLPPDAIVEVPAYVDFSGISIVQVGELPAICAAMCNAAVAVQRMAVVAAVDGDGFLLKQAMMMDPLVSAVCNTAEIWRMTDELLVAEAKYLPQYKSAVRRARQDVKTRRSQNAAREAAAEVATEAAEAAEAAEVTEAGETKPAAMPHVAPPKTRRIPTRKGKK
jgi:alpha-galactosidase